MDLPRLKRRCPDNDRLGLAFTNDGHQPVADIVQLIAETIEVTLIGTVRIGQGHAMIEEDDVVSFF
jgi:hypothetical protein